MKGLSRRKYAEYRAKKTGRSCSHQYISKLVKEGKLAGALLPDGSLDQAKADALLDSLADPARQDKPAGRKKEPGPGPAKGKGPSFAEAKTAHEAVKAAKARLELEEKTGKLVDREGVVKGTETAAIVLRDAIRGWPSMLAPKLAAETDPVEVQKMLDREVDAVLNDFRNALARLVGGS